MATIYSGEVSILSLIRYLENNQGINFKGVEDLYLNYLSYDVDITVGDIYG